MLILWMFLGLSGMQKTKKPTESVGGCGYVLARTGGDGVYETVQSGQRARQQQQLLQVIARMVTVEAIHLSLVAA
jgi:hypothetical protein